jgi:hypothetical protein
VVKSRQLMTERSWVQAPTIETFFGHHSFGSKLETKIVENSKPGIVACAVIWPMGGWSLRNGWFIKSSYMAKNELYACQLTETIVLSPNFFFIELSYNSAHRCTVVGNPGGVLGVLTKFF